MKIKVSILAVALYILAILLSCGLFSVYSFETQLCYAETDTEVMGGCDGEVTRDALHEPAAYAITGTCTSYDTYREAYFANLTENFGYNYKGSCGYVAAGMLLSYFDNYYSDDILPEKYDIRSKGTGRNMNMRGNSPGVMNDNYLNEMYKKATKDVTAQEYYNYLLEYENYSFHAKLILFANQYNKLYNFDNNDQPCLITTNNLMSVIQLYLYYERGYKWGYDFWFKNPKSNDEDAIKQFVIDQIDAGLPVLTMIGKLKSDGTRSYHFVIAYAHDGKGTIYVHSGWHSSYYSTRETIYDLGYDFYNTAFSLNFYVPEHIHTDNYEVTSGSEINYYCYCSDEIVTYKHTEHNYKYDYSKMDTTTHRVYCCCGDYLTENHNYYYISKNALKHTARCQCGATELSEHIWTSYSDPLFPGRYGQCKLCKYVKKLVDENVNVTLGLKNYDYYLAL